MAKLASFVELVRKFRSKADFVIVYIDEMHASDQWAFRNNYSDIPAHKCLEDRVTAARMLLSLQEVNCPLVVDTMSNEARYSYAALPERLYIIKDGKVEYAGNRGPEGYHLEEVEKWLVESIG